MAVSRIGTWSSGAGSLTLTHANGAGSNRIMIVCVQIESASLTSVNSIDYGGQAMTELLEEVLNSAADQAINVFYLLESENNLCQHQKRFLNIFFQEF